jgi:hypothetical protein
MFTINHDILSINKLPGRNMKFRSLEFGYILVFNNAQTSALKVVLFTANKPLPENLLLSVVLKFIL